MPTAEEQRRIDITHAYLAAVDAFDVDAVARLLAPDAVETEFPNAMTPAAREHGREDILTGTREAQIFLRSQRTDVLRVVAAGDRVAVEAVWTGVLSVELGPLKEGSTLRAYTARFFTFQGDTIAALHNYSNFELPAP